ncbi:MAG TPA: hypothetical protein VG099_30100, partial [Gemmataceae bacterium]|nr:hypothetical protein [Gemmataceae bacterium]
MRQKRSKSAWAIRQHTSPKRQRGPRWRFGLVQHIRARSYGLLVTTIAAALGFLVFWSAAAMADMKDELKLASANLRQLGTKFGTYGYNPLRSIFWESGGGFRFWLPADVAGIPQTGVYSLFTLAGECEVTSNYELLALTPPRGGYGSGVGLAFDIGDDEGRGSIERLIKTPEGSGYALQVAFAVSGGKVQEEFRFVKTDAKRGRIGLRRNKKELIFLAADAPAGALQEIERLPFIDTAIRAVRFFADAGGSPTAIDARLRDIEMRAEEIT